MRLLMMSCRLLRASWGLLMQALSVLLLRQHPESAKSSRKRHAAARSRIELLVTRSLISCQVRSTQLRETDYLRRCLQLPLSLPLSQPVSCSPCVSQTLSVSVSVSLTRTDLSHRLLKRLASCIIPQCLYTASPALSVSSGSIPGVGFCGNLSRLCVLASCRLLGAPLAEAVAASCQLPEGLHNISSSHPAPRLGCCCLCICCSTKPCGPYLSWQQEAPRGPPAPTRVEQLRRCWAL